MRYVKTPPTKPGCYWIKYDSDGNLGRSEDAAMTGDICRVSFDPSDGAMCISFIGDDFDVGEGQVFPKEWSDEPIEEPSEG